MVLEGQKIPVVARAPVISMVFNSLAYTLMELIRQKNKGARGGYPSPGRYLQFFIENNAVSGIFELRLQL